MSSVPVYAINTSCRSAECLRRWPVADSSSTAGQFRTKPPNLQKIQTTAKQGRPRSYSNSSDSDIPPLAPPISPDAKVRSSSLTQLDRQNQSTPPVKSPLATQSYSYNQYQRERIMDTLNIFN